MGRGLKHKLIMTALSCLLFAAEHVYAHGDTCPAELHTANLISHDMSVSFCELCDVGTVTLEIENPFSQADDADFSNLIVTEDLRTSGLTYVTGTTSFNGINVATPSVVEPAISGTDDSVLTWTLDGSFVMNASPSGNPGTRPRLEITFNVQRNAGDEEGLVADDRTLEGSVQVTPSCDATTPHTGSTGLDVLPLREPLPEIIKTGRNLDAGQGPGSYSDPVYGHEFDDVIWRVEVRNNGLADLQDLQFSDIFDSGNFEISHVCDSETDATSVATGGGSGDCLSVGGVTEVLNFSAAQVFGSPPGSYIAAPAGGSGFYYFVGTITNSCVNRVNTVSAVEWGCQGEGLAGGIAATSAASGGIVPGDDALLSTESITDSLDVDVFLTGVNTSQPMGARGMVRIRIRNLTGGTIKGGVNGLRLRDVLPAQYVIDPTFTPTAAIAPAYGNAYPGMLDEVEWTNPAADTFPNFTTNNPALPLSNTDLDFLVTSSTEHPDYSDQKNMLRHGDVLNIRFRTVLIDPTYYDREAYVDVRTEAPDSDPANTDPAESFAIDNQLEVWFEEFCTTDEHYLPINTSDDAEPEDLDVDIVGTAVTFILTNTDPLSLSVDLRNNGGHDATDYLAYVTFGEAMQVEDWPDDCAPTSNPPPLDVWRDPVGPPASASIFECNSGTISPNATETLTFEVIKNPSATADDDLTFRADVIGQIVLSDDTTALWFPPPIARSDGVLDPANNYSNDAVRARVVGYNLLKNQFGDCSENNPPPGSPDNLVQIGEECSVRIESGGWFGFQTPGFNYIAVQNIQVEDQLPNGQGYISSTDPFAAGNSTTAIEGVTLNPPPAALDEGPFDWTFNTVVPDQRIDEIDHWFRVNATTRLLNDPLDSSAPPNLHAALSPNVLDSTFEAVFFNPLINAEEVFTLGQSTVGFPPEFRRRVDLTVTEPNLIVVKEVCNETLYGVGPGCSNFVPLADDGDAYDTYLYRVTVTNEAAANSVPRAPAYDVTVTSVTDPGDWAFVDPLGTDGLDNDGDGDIDEPAEGVIVPDNTVLNGTPAEIITTYDDSDALLRIDPGTSVVLYYRIDPDDDVAPLQQLYHAATATYDSLEGVSGNQSAPLGSNGEAGGARQYTSAPGSAIVRIIPVEVDPKQITALANSALVAPANPQPVSIGEELEFLLRTLIPVAQLRNFVVRDELPVGMSCSHAPDVNLDAPPYDAGGFMPGGTFTPTCTDTEVVWDFGDQTVTQAPGGASRFDFAIQFIARINNVETNQDGVLLTNGGTATVTTVSYIDEIGNPVVIDFDAARALVSEPLIELTKTFSVPQVDADDVVTVTVTATNNGSATGYNLRVLDDLTAVDLTFLNAVTGVDPPDVDTTTFGPDMPLFTWAPGYALPPGGSVEFSFDVQVGSLVQPLQVLPNTVQADWTSLPSQQTALNPSGEIGVDGTIYGMRNGALPNVGDLLNDYEAEADSQVTVYPPVVAKTDLTAAEAAEIGSHRQFQLDIYLPEGSSENVRISDNLDAGNASFVFERNADFDLTYEFVGITSVNGLAPDESALIDTPLDGTAGLVSWDIGSVITETEDDSVVADVDPLIRISYFARINNDLDTNAGSTLQNNATVYFRDGETGGAGSVTDAAAPVIAIEPNLTATMAVSNVTPGKAAIDPLALDDLGQYVLTVTNPGGATAYDINIVDTLPVELLMNDAYEPTAFIDGNPVAGFVATPAGTPAGPLIWGRDNGDVSLDLPPGSFLELTFQVRVQIPAEDPDALTSTAWIDWTSRQAEDVYERTGAGCPTITAPNDYCYGPVVVAGAPVVVDPPEPLYKANSQAYAGIGEPFRYTITVPPVPYTLPLYDVRIVDDLAASDAELIYVGLQNLVDGTLYTLENTGTGTNLVIEDSLEGIDIPAGEQVMFDITVYLADTPANVDGLPFTNTATWTYNRFNDNPASVRDGAPGTSEPMTIGEPELTLEKSGPAQMRLGLPGTFTLDVHNVSLVSAWGTSIYDVLPDGPDGGMCDAAPAQITAQIFDADLSDEVSPVLEQGVDYTVSFDGAPDCRLSLSLLTPAAVIGADQRLIVTYQATLDLDSQQGTTLTNLAAATAWSSIDDPDRARAYTRDLTDGTPGVLDHEDAYSVLVNLPQVNFAKRVANLTTAEDPATVATPGDTLRYRLYLENTGDVALDDFSVTDDLDHLNDLPGFQAGSLAVVAVPTGANSDATDPAGGTRGTGLLQVDNLMLDPGDNLLIEFDVTLAPVIANGSYVLNQASATSLGLPLAVSDDPEQNGAADPDVAGDEDPTRVLIESAPAFDIDKISTYLEGDPSVLLAGESLRYTITVQNIGTDHATGVTLRDQIPANVGYVAGSATLNGTPLTDTPEGLPPFVDGMLINSPGEASDGYMSADVTAPQGNVAVIGFDVTTYPDLIDGTVISNQAYLDALDNEIVDQPSDDPRTPLVDDPTRDVVGSLPLIFAEKYAVLEQDYGSPGVVDPGDVLRYTIRVYNNGAVDASNVYLMDGVPANTTYMADSLLLNGEAVGQPDGGAFPLEAGVPISSSNLTPPLPAAGEGVLTAGYDAIVQFDLRINDGVATGTLITNQAVVTSQQLANVLTDGDGDPATGPEPTVVVVGPAQQLAITKEVAVVGGGPALAGSTLEYVVQVRNIGVLPALGVRLLDNLDDPLPGQLTFSVRPPTLNGETAGVVVNGTTLSVDYGDLEPGAGFLVRFLAEMNSDLPMGTTVTNQASVYWNDTQRADALASVDVGGIVGVGILNGSVWHDSDYDDQRDGGEFALDGWIVQLYRNDQLLFVTTTDADGAYQMSGVTPNYLNNDTLEIVFSGPATTPRSAKLGRAYSADFVNELQAISAIVVQPGNNLLNLDLPIDPNGVIYDSVSRDPVAGVTLTLVGADNNIALPTGCFDDPLQQNQVTRGDGYYKFDLNFSEPACPAGGTYAIRVIEPNGGYTEGYSEIIPPSADDLAPAFSVPMCPGSVDDAVPGTDGHCELQASEFAPGTGVRAQSEGTKYYVNKLIFDGSDQPGSAQIFNNHIPVDPVLEGVVAISKTTPKVNVIRGEMVPYTITVTNTFPIDLQDVGVVDRFPPGFRYIEGSARIDGVPVEPTVSNRELLWEDLSLVAEGQSRIELLLGVGAGVTEGEYVNRTQAYNTVAGIALSGEATATVRLVADPTFDCTDVMGKVFDDENRNGIQDTEEPGLPGVRLVTATGLAASTDQYGRYHITCALVPREDRGSNFVMKLDDRTLPSGFRSSTDAVQIKRATRGKALRFNFGASIHRVVGLEIADGVFESESTDIRPQWWDRFDLLLEELQKDPSVLRVTYLADLEDPKLVNKRIKFVKKEIARRWRDLDCCYRLELEHDVFWRLGGPAEQAVKRAKR